MKKLLLIIALVVAGMSVKAQDKKNVPTNATQSFQKKYPNAQKVDWDKEGNGYEAEFKQGKKEYEVFYDNSGNWTYTKIKDVPFSELPQQVKDALNTGENKNWEIRNIKATERPNSATEYDITLRSGEKEKKLMLDNYGRNK